jgi:hypothetical protein
MLTTTLQWQYCSNQKNVSLFLCPFPPILSYRFNFSKKKNKKTLNELLNLQDELITNISSFYFTFFFLLVSWLDILSQIFSIT